MNVLQRSLQHVIEQCEIKSTKLTSQFYENYADDRVRSVFSSPRDFFQSQLKFLKHAYKHVEIQSAVGRSVLAWRDKVREFDLERNKLARMVIDEYMQLLREEHPDLKIEEDLPFDPDTELAFIG